MGFKNTSNVLETLKIFLERKPNEGMPFIKNVQTLKKVSRSLACTRISLNYNKFFL
jgi:hypothetical protein